MDENIAPQNRVPGIFSEYPKCDEVTFDNKLVFIDLFASNQTTI